MNVFTKIWKLRTSVQPKVYSGNWARGGWSRGRGKYLTFVIRIDDEKVAGKILDIQKRLSVIPCVDLFPKDYFHITVKGGGFLVETKKSNDEISRKNVAEIISQAEKSLRGAREFKISLKRLNIFSDVVFVEIHDNGEISRIHELLKERVNFLRSSRFEGKSFVPHLSICGFKSEKGFDKLLKALEKLRDTSFGTYEVNSLDLVIAHLNHKYPVLETIRTFEFQV